MGGLLLVPFAPAGLFLIAAGASAAVVLILRFGIRERPGVASGTGVVKRTREVNRGLLGSPVTRPLYLAMWVPNGIIVGCEALFVPFAGQSGPGICSPPARPACSSVTWSWAASSRPGTAIG
ncbi:hypothetical protein [Actinoplanes xinjiangensis]|uniref:Uncharacterized protein n=1 Tax=Actinoplanes xinjiangensis TaxID=512350 RepID=A0A316FFB5_9ACTN|nr:hypothetical protein [Actinoplanes xinjiangensis]PWK47053.1 hypothetical protein BC793_108167 [Actinoplanes xinjiangensis]GIF40213.1 hypothetical protein Axi01nite_45240 [Actinoplanes xinjiangensis]